MCDAYTPVYPLTVVKSADDMIRFIERTENFFKCVEDYELYYGFEKNGTKKQVKLLKQ